MAQNKEHTALEDWRRNRDDDSSEGLWIVGGAVLLMGAAYMFMAFVEWVETLSNPAKGWLMAGVAFIVISAVLLLAGRRYSRK